jgi:hypothetical protein
MSIPQTINSSFNFTMVKPRTYEFRVAETVDDTGKIIKVGLQIQEWEHDEFGSPSLYADWRDVDRVTLNKNGLIVTK